VTQVDATTGEIGEYLREIAQYPLLSAEEEVELARQIAIGKRAAHQLSATVTPLNRADLEAQVEAGVQARRRMVESNLRLVVSIARRYAGRGLSLQDLIQEGNIGLQTGIDRYDWQKGYRLSTYIYWWIRQAMTRALANDSRIIRLPVHAGELLRSAAQAEQQLRAELLHEPTIEQVATRLGIEAERLRTIRRIAASPGSLDRPVGRETERTHADMLVDEAASDIFQLSGVSDEVEDSIGAVLDELPERERTVVQLHFGVGTQDPLSLAQIGKKMGITRERARQIETQALRRMRNDSRLRRAFFEVTTA
jgi:RNA polymerase primary sigma factor